MLRAFADGEDVRVAGDKGVIHQHAASAGEPRRAGKAGIGPDAAGHDEMSAGSRAHRPAAALNALRAFDGDALRLQFNLYAVRFNRLAQKSRRMGVELAFHEAVHQMDEGGGGARAGEAARGFQSQQAAADHHGPKTGLCSGHKGLPHPQGRGTSRLRAGPHRQRQADGLGARGQD